MALPESAAPQLAVNVEFEGTPHCSGHLRAFSLGSRRIVVSATIDRWHGVDYCYLKLEGEDGAAYILRHDEMADRWALTLFQADSQQQSSTGPRFPPPPLS